MARVKGAVELILAQQEPYPAFVMGGRRNVLMSNAAARRFRRLLLGEGSTEANIVRPIRGPGACAP